MPLGRAPYDERHREGRCTDSLADSSGVNIACQVHGTGELDLVFVPGGQGLSDRPADLHEIELEVRAGIHTGEIELIGDDVGGMAVNIGARIGTLAGPGEVLVSSTVRGLVVGSGLEFAERAPHAQGAPDRWPSSRRSRRATNLRRRDFDQRIV